MQTFPGLCAAPPIHFSTTDQQRSECASRERNRELQYASCRAEIYAGSKPAVKGGGIGGNRLDAHTIRMFIERLLDGQIASVDHRHIPLLSRNSCASWRERIERCPEVRPEIEGLQLRSQGQA